MMNIEVEMLIEMMLPLSSDERLEIFAKLKEAFCPHCGVHGGECSHCQDDT